MITFDSLKSLYEFVDSMSVRKIGSERVDEHEPQKKRIVYVVEQLSIDRSGRPSSVVNVYDTHDTALDASINVMRSNMKRAGLDDSSHAQHSKYVNFTDDVSNGNRMSAIDEYFQSTVGYTDPVYCYSRIVEGDHVFNPEDYVPRN